MEWPIGTPVRYAEPLDDYEASLIMYVVEDRGPRVLVGWNDPNFSPMLQPQAVYLKTDLAPAE